MTRDDIIKLAREAGATVSSFHGRFVMYPEDIERFAVLVSAAERNRLESAAECFRMCKRKGVCNEETKIDETDYPAVLGKG